MNKYILFFLLIISFANAIQIEVGTSQKGTISSKEFYNLITKVTKNIFNKKNQNLKIVIKNYGNNESLLKDYKKAKILTLLVAPRFYFSHEKEFNKYTKYQWNIGFNNQVSEQYYLIANKDFKDPFNNLHKAKVSTLNGFKNEDDWFKYFIYKKYKTSFSNIIKIYTTKKKESKLIYDIFFDKNQISIVNSNTFKTLLELNSQLKQKVIILAKSKKIFIPLMGFSHKNMSQEKNKNIFQLIARIEHILDASPFSDNIKISDFIPSSKSNTKQLREFYKEYESLKQNYEK